MKVIANSFNENFSNIGPSLSEKIDMSGNTCTMAYSDYLTNPVHSKFSFSPVSEKETLNINLKNKKSYGIDAISNVLLKSIANEILKPLTLIINQPLESGIFSDACLSGSCIHIQLYDYFCKNNLLSEHIFRTK